MMGRVMGWIYQHTLIGPLILKRGVWGFQSPNASFYVFWTRLSGISQTIYQFFICFYIKAECSCNCSYKCNAASGAVAANVAGYEAQNKSFRVPLCFLYQSLTL